MEFQVNFKVNAKIFLKDPETSEIGKQIVRHSIDLINNLGFEQFTFKKLASDIGTTEATVYRYFENKYRILLYILNWYWSYMEFLLIFRLQNVHDKHERIRIVINLLTHELPDSTGLDEYNKKSLNQIVIAESSKVYLVKEVSEINKNEVFKPYKDLCSKISEVITDYNPTYKYPKIIEYNNYRNRPLNNNFFSNNLPRLTDNTSENTPTYTSDYIEDMVFKILG